MTDPQPGRDHAAHPGRRPRPGTAPAGHRDPVLRPTAAQRALVPLVWGVTALVVAALTPLSGIGVAAATLAVAVGSWLLAGRSAVVLGSDEVVVRRPVGRVVVPLADLEAVERRRPALTERAELVRRSGRRVALPAPQHGPLPALRDPAFDERVTLIRYRIAKGPSRRRS